MMTTLKSNDRQREDEGGITRLDHMCKHQWDGMGRRKSNVITKKWEVNVKLVLGGREMRQK